MNIYLKWTDPYLSDKENISLFDLEISQEETCFTKARLVIDALTPLPPTGTEGILWEGEQHILFKGRLVGNLVKLEGAFGEIELIARPVDFLAKIHRLQKANRTPPYWDELWISPNKKDHFEETQDVRTASLFCDSRTGGLSLSDWFEGSKTITLTSFFPQSLSIKIIQSPLKACTVNVHAHWIQGSHGISNLSPQIRRAFPHRQVNTYTDKAIMEKWPEPQKRLGRSGVWILKSELKPMMPSSPLYPTYSPPLSLGEEGKDPKNYRLKRYWFKPQLMVRWKARQKRKETLSLTLHHEFHPLFPGEGEHKTVEFTLQNINPDPEAYPWQPDHYYRQGTKVSYQNSVYKCKSDHQSDLTFEKNHNLWIFKKYFHTPLGNPARSSFFLTDRGNQAAEHAMERAKVILAQSARCVEVSFEGAWDDLKEVTTDMSLTLADPRLPGGQVTGKVVKHVLIAKGETGERVARISLLCAAGTGTKKMVNTTPTPTYSLESYGDPSYQVYENQICRTPTGLSYFKYDSQSQPENITRGSLLRGVQLTNGPKDQEDEMVKHAYTSPAALKKALAQTPIHLRLFFKDLRTKERLDHHIVVRMAESWSAPLQLNLV